MFDLPEPFGPDDDTDARLELERGLVGEGLEALQASTTSGTTGPLLRRSMVGARDRTETWTSRPPDQHLRQCGTDGRRPTGIRVTSTASTWARGGPFRHQAITRSTAARGPSNSASTAPSARLRTKPRDAFGPRLARGTSRGTRRPARGPVTTTRTRMAVPPVSHLARLAVERRAVRVPGAVHGATAPLACLAFAVVDLVVVAGTRRACRTGRRTARRRATSRGTSPRPAASRRSRGTGAALPAATASRSAGPTSARPRTGSRRCRRCRCRR